jgi:hypothetical protein
MRLAASFRYTAAAAALLTLLAGCGRAGANPTLSAPSGDALHRGQRSWIQPGASNGALLYIAANAAPDNPTTLIYSYPQGKLVGSLDAEGGGMCSDTDGNVFLARRDAVTEYAHGGTTPIETLRVPGASMLNCSVDATTKDLAVTMSCYPCGYENLAIFPNETGKATRYLTGNDAWTCGYDSAGNLFVSDSSNGTSLRELPEGSSNFTTVTLDKDVGDVNQVQWDGRHIALQNLGNPGDIYPIEVSGSTATVLAPTSFKVSIDWTATSWIYNGTVVFAFNRHDNSPNEFGIWRYPHGGHALKTVKKIPYGDVGFDAVVVSAAPSHTRPR